MNWSLELVLIPVSDVDRAKAFYAEQLGFHLDVDHQPNEHFRVVQLTPPGSSCSVSFGVGLGDAEPGSVRGLHLVVADIDAARDHLVGAGVECSEVVHFENGQSLPGRDPQRQDYNSFVNFSDLDGNTWVVQEVPSRGAST